MSQFSIGGWGKVPEEILDIHKKVSVSGIMEAWESPAHFEAKYILNESEETDAMRMGTAAHMAILEPEKFKQSYCVEPESTPDNVLSTLDEIKKMCEVAGLKKSGTKAELLGNLVANGYKFKSYDDFIYEYANGREVMKQKDWVACERIVKRIDEKPKLKYLMSDGKQEELGWALHARTGLVVSFKTDYFKRLKKPFMGCANSCLDVKKVQSVKKRNFERLIWDRALFIQAALYVDLLDALTKEKTLFSWVAVDAKPPYPVMGYPADFGMLEAGRNEYEKTLTTISQCFDSGRWPDYSDDLHMVTLPKYAWDQLEERDYEYENE